jgi:hypothetical protein
MDHAEAEARLNVARRLIGDLSIEKAAMVEAIEIRDLRIAELERSVEELEVFTAAVGSGDPEGQRQEVS